MQTIGIDARERAVIEHDDRVGVVREALEREERVVRLHDHVALLRVGEHRVCLHQLLRELVVQPLEHERAQSGARPPRDGVHHHEALNHTSPPAKAKGKGVSSLSEEEGRETHLERVTTLRFAINHLHNVLVQLLATCVSLCPIVSRTTAILGHEDVLRVVKVRERRRQYIVDDLPEMPDV